MKHLVFKNKKFRLKFKQLELKNKIKKFIFIHYSNKFDNRINLKNFSYSTKISKTKLKRYCILSNRSKGIFRSHSISRLCLKNLITQGILPGYKKAVW